MNRYQQGGYIDVHDVDGRLVRIIFIHDDLLRTRETLLAEVQVLKGFAAAYSRGEPVSLDFFPSMPRIVMIRAFDSTMVIRTTRESCQLLMLSLVKSFWSSKILHRNLSKIRILDVLINTSTALVCILQLRTSASIQVSQSLIRRCGNNQRREKASTCIPRTMTCSKAMKDGIDKVQVQ